MQSGTETLFGFVLRMFAGEEEGEEGSYEQGWVLKPAGCEMFVATVSSHVAYVVQEWFVSGAG